MLSMNSSYTSGMRRGFMKGKFRVAEVSSVPPVLGLNGFRVQGSVGITFSV